MIEMDFVKDSWYNEIKFYFDIFNNDILVNLNF